MDTLQMPTRAPAFTRSFPAVAGFFDSAWQAATLSWLPGRGGSTRQLEMLRGFVLASLEDCTGPEAERLRARVQRATSAQRLATLREALFNGISRAQCQSAASRFLARFDQLAPRRQRTTTPAHARRGSSHAA